MQRLPFTLTLSLLLFLAIVPKLLIASTSAQVDPASELLDLVNGLRAQYSLPPYQYSPELTAAAQAHTEWRASVGEVGEITHFGPDNSRPSDRALAAGYGGGFEVRVLENVAGGRDFTPADAVAQWQGDADHLNVMVSDFFVDAGVGYAERGRWRHYTLMVGRVGDERLSTQSVSATSAPTATPTASQEAAQSPALTATATPALMATAEADGSITHVLQRGETLGDVAEAFGVDMDELLALNRLSENSLVFPGQEIIVRAPASATPAPVVAVPSAEQGNRALLMGVGAALAIIGATLIGLAQRRR